MAIARRSLADSTSSVVVTPNLSLSSHSFSTPLNDTATGGSRKSDVSSLLRSPARSTPGSSGVRGHKVTKSRVIVIAQQRFKEDFHSSNNSLFLLRTHSV